MACEERPDSGSTDNLKRCGRGGRGADEALWRVAAAEALGTALLVSLGCLPACEPALGAPQRALAAGLVVALLVQCFDHISGAHLNPTVTLAAVLWGGVSRGRGACEAAAQLLGAVCGGALLTCLDAGRTPALCVTLPGERVSPLRAAAVEALLGGSLALANCAAWDARTRGRGDSWPLRVGLAVAGLSLAAGGLTGASMNPARSFGPALWSGDWTSHWVYWVGPLSGSFACTALYCGVWRPRVCPRAGPHAPAPRAGSHAPVPRAGPDAPAPCAGTSAPAPAGTETYHTV